LPVPAPPAAPRPAVAAPGPVVTHPNLAGSAVPAAARRQPAPDALAPRPGPPAAPDRATAGKAFRETGAPGDSALIGRGWDTVLVRRVRPSSTLLTSANRPVVATDPARRGDVDLLQRISSPISGPWGKGRLVSTPIGNAVITTDGRMATGAVPAQVLTEALSCR
jgi:hypothetical protein